MRFSVIINCYNTKSLLNKCVNAVRKTASEDSEILLINNHPLYTDVQVYLKKINLPRVKVLDPGKNIGCIPGFQFGAAHATGEYLIKLDDDIIVPKGNWLSAMAHALADFPELAYIALIEPSYRVKIKNRTTRPEYTIEFHDGFVMFGCMMIKKSLWQSNFIIKTDQIYGIGEYQYMLKAKEIGLKKAYLISHVCKHLGRTPAGDPLYGAWKLFFGKRITKLPYEEWRHKFTFSDADIKIMSQFGYPQDQIHEIQNMLKEVQSK